MGKEKTESTSHLTIYPRDPSVPRGFFLPYAQLQTTPEPYGLFDYWRS